MTENTERAVAAAWGDYYRPGMSSEEAQAFKAGFAAAEREPVVVDDATLEAEATALGDFMEDWYDRWAGPGEQWTLADMASGIVEGGWSRREPIARADLTPDEAARIAEASVAAAKEHGGIVNAIRAEREPVVVDDATEWEYAHAANGYWNEDETEFIPEEWLDVDGESAGALARRKKAGAWIALTPDGQGDAS